MIKATTRLADGRFAIVMGVSAMNIQRLVDGQPIHFDPTTLHIPPGTDIGGITLFYGRDDDTLSRMMKDLIGPETEVIVVPRGDERPQ